MRTPSDSSHSQLRPAGRGWHPHHKGQWKQGTRKEQPGAGGAPGATAQGGAGERNTLRPHCAGPSGRMLLFRFKGHSVDFKH